MDDIVYIDPQVKKQKRKKIVALVLLIFAILSIYPTYTYLNSYFEELEQKQELRKLVKSAQNEEGVLPTPPVAEVETTQKVCEYVDYIHKEISPPDSDDKIQKNIGYQNNKVGIYIYAEVNDFVKLADELVNSNGGEWGYVLIPYNVKDYNSDRWGKLFQRLSEKKLIPIIQLWDLDLDVDKVDGQIQKSAEFLDSLQWPIQNRYVSVYNEPNDSKFWKGKTNPEEYAIILEKTINTFKALDSDFFMMNGAMNASARSGGDYIDAREFMRRMNNQVPGIFNRLDGWASHPYPQPNFSGSPSATGRDSIRAYEWELNILKNDFKVDISDLPVFITETGWTHRESEFEDGNSNGYKFNKYQVADNMKYAFEKVWLPDDRVVAITPFTIRYGKPFDHFSWVTTNNGPYPQFEAVQSIKKVKGNPPVVSYYPRKILQCKQEVIQ